MATYHRDLTGADLHEPKGIDTASLGEMYVADGAGSGSWGKLRLYGFENNADSGVIQPLTAGVFTTVTNNTNGAFDTDFLLPNQTSRCWNPTLNEFNFNAGGVEVNELIEFNFEFVFNSTSASSNFKADLIFAEGTLDEYIVRITDKIYKAAGTHPENVDLSLFMPAQVFIDNPCKVKVFTDDSSGSVVVKRFYLKVTPKYPVVE